MVALTENRPARPIHLRAMAHLWPMFAQIVIEHQVELICMQIFLDQCSMKWTVSCHRIKYDYNII